MMVRMGWLAMLAMLPWPAPLDLQLQSQAEEGPNQDDKAENDDVIESGIDNYCANNVASYKKAPAESLVPYPGDKRDMR
jgi:hypothetical protein